ncbi:MAG TPA: 1,4-alpha-glucan branching protein GlgB [bacterium]|nr:1,4-alpha-glucan branching protein GlgB [bacterium]
MPTKTSSRKPNLTKKPDTLGLEITDFDLYLMSEGTHYNSYEKFGAIITAVKGVSGVHFVVWAPNAKAVSVVGNFNQWQDGAHPMIRINEGGVWGLFIPGLSEGELYKYSIRGNDGQVHMKSDPYAFQAELRPRTACIVTSLDRYQWHDRQWMKERAGKDPLKAPISVYEVHLGSWKRDSEKGGGFLNYRELAHQLVDYVKGMGYTHIELMPVMEHPLDESWGYQVINYFAPTSRFGTPEDFMYFVDYCHQHGVGVILDWVPSHFPKDGHGLNHFDGRQIYAYEDWKKGEHREWGTLVFDYGRNEVKNFLISNALFWLEKYHIDGLRVDAVASMIYLDYARYHDEWQPNVYGGRENIEAIQFLKEFNEVVHSRHQGALTIAEESTAWPGVSRPTYLSGLGFSMKWNMGWMHDTLEYFSKDPIYRQYQQGTLTFCLLYAFHENFMLPLSHDEVVHGKRSLIDKMPGDDWQKFANLRLLFGLMFGYPGKKLLFMGDDFAQWDEWVSQKSLDWHLTDYDRHRQIQRVVRELNAIYRGHKALWELDFDPCGFEWVDFSDADSSIVAFLRWSAGRSEFLLFTCNMTPVLRYNYRFGVPQAGFYQEIFNSDAADFGGSGNGNCGGVQAEPIAWHGRSYSVSVTLPPLAMNIFRIKRKS